MPNVNEGNEAETEVEDEELTEVSDREVLVQIAAMALHNPEDFCASEVFQAMRACGREYILEIAEGLEGEEDISDDNEELEDDQEPGDELEE